MTTEKICPVCNKRLVWGYKCKECTLNEKPQAIMPGFPSGPAKSNEPKKKNYCEKEVITRYVCTSEENETRMCRGYEPDSSREKYACIHQSWWAEESYMHCSNEDMYDDAR